MIVGWKGVGEGGKGHKGDKWSWKKNTIQKGKHLMMKTILGKVWIDRNTWSYIGC